MDRREQRVHANARRNLGQWVALLALAISCTAAGAGIWNHIEANNAKESARAARTAVGRATPCVDRSRRAGLQPSRGCARMFALLVNYCAEHPVACARSQRRAVRAVQRQSADNALQR